MVLLEISQEAEECYGWADTENRIGTRAEAGQDQEAQARKLLRLKSKKDNAVAVIWLSDNFPLGISNNKDI